MKRFLPVTFFFAALVLASCAGEFKFGNQILKVPDGFEIELVSNTNLIHRPVAMDFDELGRLYVTDSSGSSEKGPTQYEQKNHRVMRLEDTDGDGKFDKSTTFADNMMFPEGCIYLDGSVYVGAPPSIWKLTDTNNDGIADVRVEWHQGKTLTGCANDIHGPYLGPDGWIYWCKGAFQEQTYEVNGKPWSSKAAHIFRARPDHTGIEPVLTGGMDNPVAVAFSPEGERFLAGTFFEPGIPGRRDGVIHAIYGGVYGKNNPDVLDGHKRTGDLMPVMTHLGASASCSLIFYRSKIFGDDFQNNMLVCNFNLHNVTRHVLEPDGATFKTKDSVFLSCENDPDFHPTCVLEDADGSLLVIDTGGWYKICCPTSQLYKPDVLGAIYRIKKIGAKKIEDPRGLKIQWAKLKPVELVKFLDDERPRELDCAIHELAKRNGESIPALRDALKNSKSMTARRNAIWALTQIDAPKARHAVYDAFSNQDKSTLWSDASVLQTAMYSIGLWRDANVLSSGDAFWAVVGISGAESSDNFHARRIAAELLGRIGDAKYGVRHLFYNAGYLRDGHYDRVLEHSIIYALIELGDAKATANGLTNSLIQRVALIALDQMDNGGLKPEQVTPLLASRNKRLKETALWIVGHHPEWGGALTGFFREQLTAKDLSATNQTELQNLLTQFADDSSVQELLASAAADSKSKDARIIALHVMSRAPLKEVPKSWRDAMWAILGDNDEVILRPGVAVARAFMSLPQAQRPDIISPLLKITCNEKLPEDLRVEAWAALTALQYRIDDLSFGFLTQSLDSRKPQQQRSTAASALARQKLTDKQLSWIARNEIGKLGPMEVLKLLPAFDRSTNEAIGLKLIASLKESKIAASLRAETLTNHIAKFPASVKKAADEFLSSFNTDAQAQKKHIDELLADLKGGDIRRGQAVFNGSKAACSSCHAIGYAGGHVGPDLTTIGQARNERDLLEAIVYPSASFVRSFEPMIVSTKSDETYSGILKKDSADEVILITGPNAEARIARADITEMRPGTVSVMPQGLDTQLTKQELTDLVTFLKATKW